jgi:polyhydroxyalkanoate synthesis regulator phasin
MAERADARSPLESLGLAGIGALVLAVERLDELGDELALRLGVDRGEVRGALTDVLEGWQREAHRLGKSTGDTATRLVTELGVASGERVRELELRVAQLEHRLKLLERGR